MAMPIYTDVPPEIEVSGELYTYTYSHRGSEQALVLTRHAALHMAEMTLRTLHEAPNKAHLVMLEAARK